MKHSTLISAISAFFIFATSLPSFAGEIIASEVTNSGCKKDYVAPATRADDDSSSWSISYENGKLTMTWNDFVANCCTKEFGSSIVLKDNKIIFNAWEIGDEMCDCICPFDITATYENIAPGHYQILFGNEAVGEVDIEEGFHQSFISDKAGINEVSTDDASLSFSNGIVTARCNERFIIDIFNASGIKIHSLEEENEAEISSFADGISYVRLTSKNGKVCMLSIAR